MSRKYKSVNIDETLHARLKECAEKLSEEHGFTISQSKAISILLYRFFNGTSSYDKPQPMPPITNVVKQAAKDAGMNICKKHGLPVDKRGKCMECS